MTSETNIQLDYTGDYSFVESVNIAAKVAFVGGFKEGEESLHLAILIESSWKPIGVTISQHGKAVTARVYDNPHNASKAEIKQQLERMLCLNVDGDAYQKVALKDKVVATLYRLHAGVRPILFASAYEAAARAIIGHQLPVRQAAKLRKEYVKLMEFPFN